MLPFATVMVHKLQQIDPDNLIALCDLGAFKGIADIVVSGQKDNKSPVSFCPLPLSWQVMCFED